MVYLVASCKDRILSGNKQAAYSEIFKRSLLSYYWESTDLSPLGSNRKKWHGIFYSRPLLLFHISCREQWPVLPPETVDYRQRQSRFEKGTRIRAMLPFLMFVFSQQFNNTKQTFNDTVNESVQAHDIGIFPACFPSKIK